MSAGRDDSGFVLVEALTALVVTAIGAAGLLAALQAASARADEASVRSLALRQARHLLAEATPMEATEMRTEGQAVSSRLSWTRRVSQPEGHPEIASIVVEVTWTSGRRTGITRLETQRLVSP